MITKNYIKMCDKAEEIQKLRYYKRGDWFYTEKHKDDYTNGFHIIADDYDIMYMKNNWITRANGIWLPMQEQLQEMMKKEYPNNKSCRKSNDNRTLACLCNERKI